MAIMASYPVAASGQEAVDGSGAGRADLAALVVHRDASGHGHRARLATHELRTAEGRIGAQVSAAVFLPDGESVARDGLIAFVVADDRAPVRDGAIGFRWHFAGMDTTLTFAARVLPGRHDVAYAAELTEADLRFLASANTLEAALPDGRVLIVDADLRRRMGLLARLSGLPAARREELAAFSHAIEGSIRRAPR